MTVRPGADFGEPVPAPAGLVVARTDAELAALARGDRPVRLTGGDLLRTLGGPSTGPLLRRVAVDLLSVDADGEALLAVAHVVARWRSWWRGPILAVMNAEHVGRWDVAPRAHPGDGVADVVEVDAAMTLRARWQASRRLPTGTHVPHPAIRSTRVRERAWTFDRPRRLWVDGVERGPVRSLRVAVEPDGAIVHT